MRKTFILAMIAVLTNSVSAYARNELYIAPTVDLTNAATLTASGDGNVVLVEQTRTVSSGSANSVAIHITGNLNGGPLLRSFAPALAHTALVPGQVIQNGHDNNVQMTVAGSSNLFAVSQVGSGNSLTASVIGNYNQAAISQFGTGNIVAFSQNGYGNVLSVIQRSQ